MNKFNSLLDPSQVEEGDIIQYATQGSRDKRRAQPVSTGYVHHVIYDPKNKDQVSHFAVFEIVPAKDAQNSPHHVINHDNAGDASGLAHNQQWAAILFPVKVTADAQGLGRRDGLVKRIGNLSQTAEYEKLLDRIQALGGDDRLFFGRGDGPRMARPSEETWGILIPVGVTRRNEADQWTEQPKKKYQKKHDFVGKELDVSLDNLVKAGILDQETSDLFQKPADKRVKPIHSLREVWKLADKAPAELEKYLPKQLALAQPVMLADIGKELGDEIHPTVVWGLSSPRDPKRGQEKAPVITTLQEAYDLVKNHPDDLKRYNYLGAKMQEYAVIDIVEAYETRAFNTDVTGERVKNMARVIKTAWTDLTNAYTGQKDDPRFLRDGQPIWELVPKQP